MPMLLAFLKVNYPDKDSSLAIYCEEISRMRCISPPRWLTSERI